MKKFIIIIIIIAFCGFTWKWWQNKERINKLKSTPWELKDPQLFSNAGSKKSFIIKEESQNTIVNFEDSVQNSLTSIDQVGEITNVFGVRDDVLDYILVTIPADKNKSRLFAIKMALYDQKAMFASEPQLNKLINKGFAAMSCMMYYYDDENNTNYDIPDKYKFMDGYEKVLRSNKLANDLWESVENRMNNHVLSRDYGIDSISKDVRCNHLLAESI